MRIVIKVGTNVLTRNSSKLNSSVIRRILGEIFSLQQKGHEVVLVSSGAIGCGKNKLPDLNIEHQKQVWAAVGQPLLMQEYNRYADEWNLKIGQCLFLRVDFFDRERYQHLVDTITAMLKAQVIPIVNGNDMVARSDLAVGDNDMLAAMTAVAIAADYLILLTNQEGLFTGNPDTDKSAVLMSRVENVDAKLEEMCAKEISSLGRGGMISKVRAAKQTVHAGIEAYIADGREPGVIAKILEGQNVGTRFVAAKSKPKSEQKRWLVAARGYGQVVIDNGAARALKSNNSLLFPGIVGLKGLFDKGEIVEIMSKVGEAVAYGKVNFSQKDLQEALRQKKEKQKVDFKREVVHKDYLIVLN